MFTPDQVAEFKTRGYIAGPKVLSDDEADRLCERMFAVLEGRGQRPAELTRNMIEGAPRTVFQIVNIWEADDLFREHLANEAICAMVAQLMDTGVVRVWHDQIQHKPPRIGGATPWHQDHPYWPSIQPADLVSAWCALDDATVENGCMHMVPGSHLWGTYKDGTIGTDPATFDPDPDVSLLPECAVLRVEPCEVRKGQVMFHHCLTWHGTPENNSERGRPAIAVHYMPGYTRYEPTRGHVMDKHAEVAPGEILQGKHFPTVWDNGPCVVAAV